MGNKKKTPTTAEVLDEFGFCDEADQYRNMTLKAAWKALSLDHMRTLLDAMMVGNQKYLNILTKEMSNAKFVKNCSCCEFPLKVKDTKAVVNSFRQKVSWGTFVNDLVNSFNMYKEINLLKNKVWGFLEEVSLINYSIDDVLCDLDHFSFLPASEIKDEFSKNDINKIEKILDGKKEIVKSLLLLNNYAR